MTHQSNKDIHIPIYPYLSKVGQSHKYIDSFELDQISFGQALYIFDANPQYEIALTNTGDAILVQGKITAIAKTSCVRCLDEIQIPINGNVEGYFFLNQNANIKDLKEDEYGFVDSKNTICINDNLYAAITYELPFTPLCNQDCKGLCQYCGCDLNKTACDCVQKIAEKKENEINPNSPFAVLKDYKFDDDD
ncbi:MAG: DUF177 domain-containing protein [Coriobacteriales bacterium]|nr:DUF177 domain-containing protein [Coriobacteriales bacterium]